MEWSVIAKILILSLLLAVNAFVALPAAALPYLEYAGPSIAESQTMERDYFAYGYGWIRWEAWTTNTLATRDPDLLGRCPGVYIKNGPWPLAEPAAGWVQTACRSWTNIIWDGDGKTTVGGISWPP
jgi:hypothetical protein